MHPDDSWRGICLYSAVYKYLKAHLGVSAAPSEIEDPTRIHYSMEGNIDLASQSCQVGGQVFATASYD